MADLDGRLVTMIRSVRLDRLPEGLTFPAELAARISFAADAHELRFEGFMSKTDFDKLLRLHNELAYQRALEQLFQKCTFRDAASNVEAKRASHTKAYLGLGVAATVAASVALLVFWNLHGHASPATRTTTAQPSTAAAVSPVPAVEVNHMTHVLRDGREQDSQSFDGEIKP
jgi:hypothetical protein